MNAIMQALGVTSLTTDDMARLNAVGERAATDFEQRQNNMGDYPEDTPEWRAYAMTYGQLLAAARANGTAI